MHATTGKTLRLSREEIRDLQQLDSCAVANAIERFRVQNRHEGYAEVGLACRYPEMAPVVGHAMTLKIRTSSSTGQSRSFFQSPELFDALLDLPTPRVLALQDMDRFPGAGALIGHVEACILKTLDCSAVITNGAVRDVSRMEGLEFQVFSGSLSVSHASSHIVQMGGTVQIGALEITSGDLVHGDRHGLVRIPRELAARIPATAAALRRKEDEIMSYCQSQDFSVEGLRDLLAEY